MADYLTDAAYIFKHNYSTEQLGPAIERDHTYLSMVTKKKGGSGADYSYPVPFSNPQAVGGTFATTQTAAGTASGKSAGRQFTTEPVLKYGVLQIDGPSMLRAGDRKGAFYDLVTGQTDGVLDELGNRLAFDLYRSGNGIRGRRASISGDIVTLTSANDARNFSVNMPVGADDTATGLSPRTGSTYVTGVDRQNGKITLNSAAAISSFTDNDYLFVPGDPGTCMDGLALMFPTTAPTSGDSFRGVDRSSDVEHLAGSRVVDTGSYWEEVLGLAAVHVQDNGQRPDVAFANPFNVFAMAKRQGAKIEYMPGKTAEVFFQYIVVNTPAGAIKVMADPDCPIDTSYVGNMDYIHCLYLGESFIHAIKDAGYEYGIQAAADGIECRFRVQSQTICPRPATWAVAQGS